VPSSKTSVAAPRRFLAVVDLSKMPHLPLNHATITAVRQLAEQIQLGRVFAVESF
jgi:hypothetical protein